MGLLGVLVGVAALLLAAKADVEEEDVTLVEVGEEGGGVAGEDGLGVEEAAVVETGGGEGADGRGHAVLDVEEVGTDAGVEEAFEEGAIEEGHVGVVADAGGRQLVGVPDQQHLLRPRLQRDQQVGLGGLGSLVNDKAGDLAPQPLHLLRARAAEGGQHDLCPVEQLVLDLGVVPARSDELLAAEGEHVPLELQLFLPLAFQFLLAGPVPRPVPGPVPKPVDLLAELDEPLLDLGTGHGLALVLLGALGDHLLLAEVVETHRADVLVEGVHNPGPDHSGVQYFSLAVDQPLGDDAFGDVVDGRVGGSADHDLAGVPSTAQVLVLHRQQPHQRRGLAGAGRALQHHEALLPQGHLPDRLPLRLVEDLPQRGQDLRQHLPLRHVGRLRLVDQRGVEDSRRQLRVLDVGHRQVLPQVGSQLVEVVEVGLAALPPLQQQSQVRGTQVGQGLDAGPQVLLGLGGDQQADEGELLVLATTVRQPIVLGSVLQRGGDQSEPPPGEAVVLELDVLLVLPALDGAGLLLLQGHLDEPVSVGALVVDGDPQGFGALAESLDPVAEVGDALVGDQVVEGLLVDGLVPEAVGNALGLGLDPGLPVAMLQDQVDEVGGRRLVRAARLHEVAQPHALLLPRTSTVLQLQACPILFPRLVLLLLRVYLLDNLPVAQLALLLPEPSLRGGAVGLDLLPGFDADEFRDIVGLLLLLLLLPAPELIAFLGPGLLPLEGVAFLVLIELLAVLAEVLLVLVVFVGVARRGVLVGVGVGEGILLLVDSLPFLLLQLPLRPVHVFDDPYLPAHLQLRAAGSGQRQFAALLPHSRLLAPLEQ